jgi:accessory gene regulator protein AgrB
MQFIGLIIVMALMGFLAKKKGFNPWLWIFAAGFLGLIILLFMPSAIAEGIDEAVKEKRRKTGNKVGAIFTVISVILVIGSIVLFVVVASHVGTH